MQYPELAHYPGAEDRRGQGNGRGGHAEGGRHGQDRLRRVDSRNRIRRQEKRPLPRRKRAAFYFTSDGLKASQPVPPG